MLGEGRKLIEILAVRDLIDNHGEMEIDNKDRNKVYILIDASGKIQEASSYATVEETFDAQIRAANKGWTFLPIDIADIARELDKAGIQSAC